MVAEFYVINGSSRVLYLTNKRKIDIVVFIRFIASNGPCNIS